jgi:hypothetical protein
VGDVIADELCSVYEMEGQVSAAVRPHILISLVPVKSLNLPQPVLEYM